MIEFDNLMSECARRLNLFQPCNTNCSCGNFCRSCHLTGHYCWTCLSHIQFCGKPIFHYNCEKITYYYVLHFFNSFASEIYYALTLSKSRTQKTEPLQIVSMGCGPGSEVYGIVGALRHNNSNRPILYRGYDLNPVWSNVQELTRYCFSQTNHSINFFTMNMFADEMNCTDFDILVLNYVLSDALKFGTYTQNLLTLQMIADFVVNTRIKCVFFNDINYYGNDGTLDSGVQMMFELVNIIRQNQIVKNVGEWYGCFPGNGYCRRVNWYRYNHGYLYFTRKTYNNYVNLKEYCSSKQVILRIAYN